ncbi:MAG: glutaredoxin family protein [Micropruina sp.]|jgi:alkyl hydroperoxide reductase subunit AhpF|nr:glutaredoxin family protein [Micropruina sp.]
MSPHPLTATTRITLVTAAGCHFCDDAHQVLAKLATDDPSIKVEQVDACSEDGRRLLGQHRAAMNPLVLINGTYFSAGRLPRRKLEALLSTRTHTEATVNSRG